MSFKQETGYHVVIADDDREMRESLVHLLSKTGWRIDDFSNAAQAITAVQVSKPDVVLSDVRMPGKSGLEVCRIVRQLKDSKSVPIIMLTAKGEEEDIVAGLDSGADDYVTKPFSPKVLIARVQAVIRRALQDQTTENETESEAISVHSLTIDPGRHEVLRNGQPVQLTNTEFSILLQLATRPGWVFTRQQIIDQARGYDYLITPRAIDVQIFGLRKKLGSIGRYIETVRGVGYRMKE